MNRTPRLSKSAIEYLDYVWNFESGCTKGCKYCYARKIATRFPDHYPNGFEPTLYPEAFRSPLFLKKPSTIGVCFMGDLFDDAIDPEAPVEWSSTWQITVPLRQRIFSIMRQCRQHRFLFLTKQPQNLAKWSPFPDNCWVGVSVTDTNMIINACKYLRSIDATVKYLSIEPLLDWNTHGEDTLLTRLLYDAGIKWVIIGAQTKPTVMPELHWAAEIGNAANAAGIPLFVKDNLNDIAGPASGKWIRQETPSDRTP